MVIGMSHRDWLYSWGMNELLELCPISVFTFFFHFCFQNDMSRDVVVHLTRLALSQEKSVELDADIYMDYSILLTVVRVAQCLPRPIKLEVAIKVRNVQRYLIQNEVELISTFIRNPT